MSTTTPSTKGKGDVKPRRIAQIVYLRPECIEEYKKCHAAVWPDVLAQIRDSNIVDYSINLIMTPRPTLYATFKWVGENWDEDMKRMSENPRVREWWEMTDGMQESANPEAKDSKSGGWWVEGEEVFYFEG